MAKSKKTRSLVSKSGASKSQEKSLIRSRRKKYANSEKHRSAISGLSGLGPDYAVAKLLDSNGVQYQVTLLRSESGKVFVSVARSSQRRGVEYVWSKHFRLRRTFSEWLQDRLGNMIDYQIEVSGLTQQLGNAGM